ncbi:hypothetical protein [Algibacter sp. L4_22]|uniref:hypothetical protein n=1 Tax=Algibacter sp. L4_22 TaxID=2942477 RepID=UPI00201B61DB|nr:hypothetical protein [Algibacter sp. L4_22]MCL5127503.1 hypothetical protein [Algibacter sp. L4_22]
MIRSVFNHELNILETQFKDEVGMQDIVDYLLSFKEKTSYPRQLRTMVDARDATLTFSYKALKSFNKAKVESLKSYTIVVSAVVINSPTTAAISTLYGAIARNKKYKYKVFSTHEAAVGWLEGFEFIEE